MIYKTTVFEPPVQQKQQQGHAMTHVINFLSMLFIAAVFVASVFHINIL